MVDVAGRAMRIQAAGLDAREPGAPVVVLEAGAGGSIASWTRVFPAIAALAPVVAYDPPRARPVGE